MKPSTLSQYALILLLGTVSPAVCLADAQSGELANDRTTLFVVVKHGLKTKPFFYGQRSPSTQDFYDDRRARIESVPSWSWEVIKSEAKPDGSPKSATEMCQGSMSTPPVDVLHDGSPAARNADPQRFTRFPCYSIPTTRYVEERIAETVPAYFEESIREREQLLEAKIEVLEQALRVLTNRLERVEAEPVKE